MLQVKKPIGSASCCWPRIFDILLYGPRLETERGLAIQVAAQKTIECASIVNLGYQALGIRREAQQMES